MFLLNFNRNNIVEFIIHFFLYNLNVLDLNMPHNIIYFVFFTLKKKENKMATEI